MAALCSIALAGTAAASAANDAAKGKAALARRAEDMAANGRTVLPPYYVRAALAGGGETPAIRKAMEHEARAIAGKPAAARWTATAVAAQRMLTQVERQFVRDPNASTLDLLPPAERKRYKSLAWDANDYPGGAAGPHESDAIALDAALAAIRPERRANSTATAVVTRDEFTAEAAAYIDGQMRPVPAAPGHRLNRYALSSFERMRSDAKRDGVDLVILDADRAPQTAARNAAKAGNTYAVASFSSHMLGLAVDFKMGQGAQTFAEVSTRPFSNILAMRRSPVHKWLFLYGGRYGWGPYTHEPWHFEYNPPGFRHMFWADFKPNGNETDTIPR
jgi:hypothetical protein